MPKSKDKLFAVTKDIIYVQDWDDTENYIPVQWKTILMIRKDFSYPEYTLILQKDGATIRSQAPFKKVRCSIMQQHPDCLWLSGFRILIPKHSQRKFSWISECYITDTQVPEVLKSAHKKDLVRMRDTPEGIHYLVENGFIEKRIETLFDLYKKGYQNHQIEDMIINIILCLYETNPQKAFQLIVRMAKCGPEEAYRMLYIKPLVPGTQEFTRIAEIAFSNPSRRIIDAFEYNSATKKLELKLAYYYGHGYDFRKTISFTEAEIERFRNMAVSSILARGSTMQLIRLLRNSSMYRTPDGINEKTYKMQSRIIGHLIGKISGAENLTYHVSDLYYALSNQGRKFNLITSMDRIVEFLMKTHPHKQNTYHMEGLWIAIAHIDRSWIQTDQTDQTESSKKALVVLLKKLLNWIEKKNPKNSCSDLYFSILKLRKLWNDPGFFRIATRIIKSGKVPDYRIRELIDLILDSGDFTSNLLLPDLIKLAIKKANQTELIRLSKIAIVSSYEEGADMLAKRLWECGRFSAVRELRRTQLTLIGSPAAKIIQKAINERRKFEKDNHI